MKKQTSRKAYSLIEVLVVIGIVGVLFGIALVYFSKFRHISEQNVCASNLRRIYILFQAYAVDHDGYYPPIPSDSTTENGKYRELHWRRSLLPYMGLRSRGTGMDADVFHSGLICPAVQRVMRERGAPDKGINIASFGANYYLSDEQNPTRKGRIAATITRPAETMMATDAHVPVNNWMPVENIRPALLNRDPNGFDYHNGAQNILYCDGRIELFRDIRRTLRSPFSIGEERDIWTP